MNQITHSKLGLSSSRESTRISANGVLRAILPTMVLLICALLWSNQTWATNRLEISVTNPTAGLLSNHAIRVELNTTNAPSFDFSGTGNDVEAFDDALNPIDFFVESIDDISDTAVIWLEVPSVPAGPPATIVYLDYNIPSPGGSSSASDTFAVPGFKYHTQEYPISSPDPANRADGEALFNFDTVAASGSGYGCTPLNAITVDNSGTFGSNEDIGFFIETFIEVTTAGTYGFRLGADFGLGGELYVNGTTIEADWNNDLWWANNYGNGDVLTGSIFLDAGVHSLRALGFEQCCDGASGIQVDPPVPASANWINLNTSTAGVSL